MLLLFYFHLHHECLPWGLGVTRVPSVGCNGYISPFFLAPIVEHRCCLTEGQPLTNPIIWLQSVVCKYNCWLCFFLHIALVFSVMARFTGGYDNFNKRQWSVKKKVCVCVGGGGTDGRTDGRAIHWSTHKSISQEAESWNAYDHSSRTWIRKWVTEQSEAISCLGGGGSGEWPYIIKDVRSGRWVWIPPADQTFGDVRQN